MQASLPVSACVTLNRKETAFLGTRFLTWKCGWGCFPRLPLRLLERTSSVTAATNVYSVPTACQALCSPPSGEQKRPSPFLVVEQDKFALNHEASALQVHVVTYCLHLSVLQVRSLTYPHSCYINCTQPRQESSPEKVLSSLSDACPSEGWRGFSGCNLWPLYSWRQITRVRTPPECPQGCLCLPGLSPHTPASSVLRWPSSQSGKTKSKMSKI